MSLLLVLAFLKSKGTAPETMVTGSAPFLKLAAVHDEKGGRLTLFALNRSLTEEMPLRVDAGGFAGLAVDQALELHDSDPRPATRAPLPSASSPRRSPACASTARG